VRLADFIRREMEAILAQWDSFASTLLPAAASMDHVALRDHARQILEAVAKDLTTYQSIAAQSEKSMGRAPVAIDAKETAAQTHALLRARSGFDINQLAAEYRALRASVLGLWIASQGAKNSHTDDDIIRFNEAIDQALAESIAFFSAQMDQARNLLLGMLGHDMRSPLQTILMTAHFLASLNAGETVSEAATRLINSGARMKALLDDLLDFNRTKLGLGINIAPTETELASLVSGELDLMRGAHPQHRLELQAAGNTQGCWDGKRLQQLLSNLVGNAVKYGAESEPVQVLVSDEGNTVLLEVKNRGPAIAPSVLSQIFDPLVRGPQQQEGADSSLGLGLYIAREIARAHSGDIQARSDEMETVFAVRLPRDPPNLPT
jgi:signal transduction histidine kinase